MDYEGCEPHRSHRPPLQKAKESCESPCTLLQGLLTPEIHPSQAASVRTGTLVKNLCSHGNMNKEQTQVLIQLV